MISTATKNIGPGTVEVINNVALNWITLYWIILYYIELNWIVLYLLLCPTWRKRVLHVILPMLYETTSPLIIWYIFFLLNLGIKKHWCKGPGPRNGIFVTPSRRNCPGKCGKNNKLLRMLYCESSKSFSFQAAFHLRFYSFLLHLSSEISSKFIRTPYENIFHLLSTLSISLTFFFV